MHDPALCQRDFIRGKERYGSSVQNSFDESKHPRADDGKFGAGGSGKKEKSDAPKKEKKEEKSESKGPKKVSREDWFAAVKASTRHWDRKGPNELILWFSGYKPAEYHEAQDRLLKVGGAVMKEGFDKQSGKTYAIVKEPKGLEKPEE